jgi:alkylation response protein AidB-like acyl-CoA dehydrogenase
VEFGLTDDQELLRDTTRRFLEHESPLARVREIADSSIGFDRAIWKAGASLGWVSLLVDPGLGGVAVSGDGLVDAAIVAEMLGSFVHPGPLISSNVTALALSTWSSSDLHRQLLPAIVEGDVVVSWCVAGPDDRWLPPSSGLVANTQGRRVALHGTRSFAEFASAADYLLVVAHTQDGPTQILVPADARGVTITPLASLDLTRRLDHVVLDGVGLDAGYIVGEVGNAGPAIEQQLRVAITLQCAETVGAVDAVFGQTLAYAKDRVVFGRPIGSYQAIKHRFADMSTWLEACKGTASAAARVARTDHGAVAVSVAKSYLADNAPAIVSDCQQITGGIAMMWEHDLHLYLRRVVANAALYGSAIAHREYLCALLDAA